MYNPLPKCLTIKGSPINGLGLFATVDIPIGATMGISHIFVGGNLIRTPLGGFYNHSDNPNCEKIISGMSNKVDQYTLKTLRAIKRGEELTVKYTLYKIKDKK